ncbi:MAG: Fic family protein [Chloroflexota bacterium]|nr:Fic family protein [Chloroflexota bacterium]
MAYAYLELADFLLIAEAVLGVPPETLARSDRVVALADSALAAPAAAFAGEEFYPELAEKAAVLCSHLVRNHPLPDGSKRTAFLCLIEFIERNGRGWRQRSSEAGEDDVVETMVRLASGVNSPCQEPQWSVRWR